MNNVMADQTHFLILQQCVTACGAPSMPALCPGLVNAIKAGRCEGRCIVAPPNRAAQSSRTNIVSDAETAPSQSLPKEAA